MRVQHKVIVPYGIDAIFIARMRKGIRIQIYLGIVKESLFTKKMHELLTFVLEMHELLTFVLEIPEPT